MSELGANCKALEFNSRHIRGLFFCLKSVAFIAFFLTIFITSLHSQALRFTPNNNQYYYVDYIQKNDSNSLGKIILLFTVTDGYKSTFVNPNFFWSDGSGKLKSKMLEPGKYQIDLKLVYRKTNSNEITFSELEDPRIIDIEISTLSRHLIKIEYVSDLTFKTIVKNISRFYSLEAGYDELIDFIFDYNYILRKYDPYCELIFPEIITDDFSKKITQTVYASWKKTNMHRFYSLCKEYIKAMKSDSMQNVNPDLLNCLSQAGLIKLNYYNAYRINYLIDLIDNSLKFPERHSMEVDNQILKSINSIKEENIDSTDRYLIIANVNKNGFQFDKLSVAYTPAQFQHIDFKKRQRGYFNCLASPTFGVFPDSKYLLWAEDKNKEKVSKEKVVNPIESKYKEIVLPVNSTLAIVRLGDNFGNKLKFDVQELHNDFNKLIIKYNCLFLTHISIPIN